MSNVMMPFTVTLTCMLLFYLDYENLDLLARAERVNWMALACKEDCGFNIIRSKCPFEKNAIQSPESYNHHSMTFIFILFHSCIIKIIAILLQK